MTDRVGQQFGNYRLLRLLGRGGSADVYLGEFATALEEESLEDAPGRTVSAPATGPQATPAKRSSSHKPNKQRDPLLATKLHRPRPRDRLVSRSHLIERLQQGMERALAPRLTGTPFLASIFLLG